MIAILDYGVGNLASISNMLKKAGGNPKITNLPAEIIMADKLLLPGVGNFDYGMSQLNNSGARKAIEDFALKLKRPVLGICLGAQILGKKSEEGKLPGLGWLDMTCHRLPETPGLRIPHMGWNQISCRKKSQLLQNINDASRFYFVHSYHMNCQDSNDILATTHHGIEFTCAIKRNNIYGTQFHPEKSLSHGLALMKAFVEL